MHYAVFLLNACACFCLAESTKTISAKKYGCLQQFFCCFKNIVFVKLQHLLISVILPQLRSTLLSVLTPLDLD